MNIFEREQACRQRGRGSLAGFPPPPSLPKRTTCVGHFLFLFLTWTKAAHFYTPRLNKEPIETETKRALFNPFFYRKLRGYPGLLFEWMPL